MLVTRYDYYYRTWRRLTYGEFVHTGLKTSLFHNQCCRLTRLPTREPRCASIAQDGEGHLDMDVRTGADYGVCINLHSAESHSIRILRLVVPTCLRVYWTYVSVHVTGILVPPTSNIRLAFRHVHDRHTYSYLPCAGRFATLKPGRAYCRYHLKMRTYRRCTTHFHTMENRLSNSPETGGMKHKTSCTFSPRLLLESQVSTLG